MGKFCFSKILTYACLAAITLAVAFLAVTTAANPASAAGETGDSNKGTLKEWDTDNLARWVSSSFGRAGARNYRIPYHNYRASGYRSSVEAKACVGYNIYDNDGNLQVVHLQAQHTLSSRQAATPAR